VLDEVFWPQWDERYYSFDKKRDGTCLAQMRNGQGDLWYLVFLPNGAAVLRGFDHESAMNPYRGEDETPWPGLFDGMPRSLLPWKNAVDIEPGEVTFVMWHTARGPWRIGPVAFPPGKDPDGSEWLLEQLDGDPESYVRLVEARLERAIDADAVRAVYGGVLDAPTILKLNPHADVASVMKSTRKMGFLMTKPKSSPSRSVTRVPQKTLVSAKDKPPRIRRAGEASFTVAVHDNRVELVVHGEPVASCAVDGPEFYASLFREVKARIEKGER
jgi:hypothetical protein